MSPDLTNTLPDEAELLRAARNGRVEAFNTLILHYQTAVYNIAYRLTGDPDAAADATQETFIAAYRGLSGFRDGNFRSWLSRIATNTCYDELRRRKRRPTESIDEPSHEFHLVSTAESPESIAQRAELNRAIQNCLNTLPMEQRTVITLCDIQGFDYEEISGMIGQALGTVKSRLFRARSRLRECLSAIRELLPDSYRPDKQKSESSER